jgi:hypothetical protein
VGVCPRRRIAPPIPGRTLVWQLVAMKSSEKTVCGLGVVVAGGSRPTATGGGAKKRSCHGQRKRKSSAGGAVASFACLRPS